MAFVLASVLFVGAGCQSGTAAHPQLAVDHPTALMDVPLAVSVEGVQPGASVTLQARAVSGTGTTWTSSATFTADSRGRVDLAHARPLPSSSYSGADPMGLLWSLAAQRGSTSPITVPTIAPDPERLTLTASSDGAATSTTVTRLTMGPGVTERQITVADQGLFGRYFSPPAGAAPHAAVLVFGGSEGGLSQYVTLEASLLASHGYPALALAYFAEPGLSPALQNVPLDYFVKALNWLGQQPGVDPSHVAVMGASRGSEAALLLAAHFPQLVHAVVAYSPSSVVNPGLSATGRGGGPAWTLAGQSLPTVTLSEYGMPSPALDPQAIIPVEAIRGPVFLVSGAADELWPSPAYAAAIIARLDAAHDAFPHQSLVYPGAGHSVAVAVPYGPAPQTVVPSPSGQLRLGGSATANARAVADSWPKLLQFLNAAG